MNTNGEEWSDRTRQWVINAVHPEARLLSARRLQGGISSLVYLIELEIGDSKREVVLRQFDNADWLRSEPDLALHEAMALRQAAICSVSPTPQLLAFDESGASSGCPSVLMTKLEGKVVLEPKDLSHWVDGMAEAIALFHRASGTGNQPRADQDKYAMPFRWNYAPYSDAALLDASAWSVIPSSWKEASAILRKPAPRYEKLFIHRDFHPANVLWSGNKVSGIVDWVNACTGPAGIDVGHCRVNLSQLYSVSLADEFLACYIRHAKEAFDYDPYWDLATLADFSGEPPNVYKGWTDLGVTGLTDALMGERLDQYLRSVLKRL
ncbi:aminoglycoside phosphotransferase family protein [Paenibacillus sp. HB172176]|uniref:aminoglycoside phosphotransferase family protein n=1 Tax=Paenibacillus sp. HB172176 TaxID=2493690 RepID=UPI00143C6C72|nr:aminoglycoside phosphotransferase family protein [Paenibacillus sp. HB172176]